MRSGFASVALAGLVLVAGTPQNDSVEKDLKKLQGTWVVTSLTVDGKESGLSPALKKKMLRMVITGDKYATKARIISNLGEGTNVVGEGRFLIDPTKSPKTVDQVSTTPLDKGRTSYGIYRVNGDKWEMCFARDGAGKDQRPTAFESKPGSKLQLIVLKREKQ